ncbi:MAG: HAD-IC family P-type ATPase, partial [Thermoplasmata archaeon]
MSDKKENRVKIEELDYKEVLSILKTSLEDGMTEEETKKRESEYGYNEILEKKQSAILSIAKKFWGITPWMLEIVIVFSLFIHNYIDAYIIAGLLIVNAIIGFTQEERATKAVEILRKKLQVNARVLRDKIWKVVPARELVPGDIVRVRAGDFVPADLKIASNNILKVDQSALTGESMPVDKKINDVLFSGSIIRRNEATAIVIKTGNKTYFGKTTELIKFAKPKLHMEEITTKIVDRLLIIVLTLIGAMFVVTYIRGLSLITVIPLALVLIVFAVPVALPAMFTVSMAFGSLEVSKKGVLLTRLSAIEDAASMDVVCADKTGTLTSNKLSISKTVELNGFSENDIILYGALASQEANQDAIDIAFISEAKARNLPISNFAVEKFTPFDPGLRRTEAEVEKDG